MEKEREAQGGLDGSSCGKVEERKVCLLYKREKLSFSVTYVVIDQEMAVVTKWIMMDQYKAPCS